MRARLDATDWRILKELQANGRITNVDLARKVGISPPPCLRRVRALESFLTSNTANRRRLGFEPCNRNRLIATYAPSVGSIA